MINARGWPVALAVAVALALPACGTTSVASQQPRKRVVVFAAASLTAAFKGIAAAHPALDVAFTFDGSTTLVEQLSAKPDVADVLATADEPTMAKASAAGLVRTSTVVATNTAVMVVPNGNPGKVTGLNASLDAKKLVVCAPSVPCGAAARTIARNAGVILRPVSEEQKVTDVLGKVTSGEADAGIVFSTDAKAVGDRVTTIPLPGADQAVNRYPIAVTANAPHGDAAAEFVRAVTGEQGRAVLASYGFTLP